ncbi:unnamed protein product, partial [Staurois parvus]
PVSYHSDFEDQDFLLELIHNISGTCQCPSVPAVSAHPCHLPVPISASSMPHFSAHQCTSMPHISAHLNCLSVSPISARQCHLSMPVSATYQCC